MRDRTRYALTVVLALIVASAVFTGFVSTLPAWGAEPFPCGGVVREMHILAVGEANGKYFGVPTLLKVVVTPGDGEVYLSTEPLTEVDMQASARLAALVAAYVAGKNYFDYDYFISVISNSTIVGGPSAGAAMTVAIVSALLDKPINESVVETGMIMPDGTIGPVGGIPEKLDAAAEVGAKVMLIPAGQQIAYSLSRHAYVDVVKLGEEKGVKVVEVSTIYDALRWFGINIPRPPKAEVKLPPKVVNVIKGWINESEKLYNQIRSRAESEVLKAPQVSDIVKQYLEKARQYYVNGWKDLRLGNYYSAASDFFASDIYADTAYWIAAIAAGDKSYEALVNRAKDELTHALNTYHSIRKDLLGNTVKNVDIAKLSVAVEIASRALDANETFNSLPQAVVSYDTIYDAVYAYWRAKTVMDWTKMYYAVPASGITVSTESLRRHASLLTYFAMTSASYIESLVGQQSAVTKVLEMADKAKQLLDTDYLAALAEALRASAYASAMLNTAFTTDIGATADRLRDAALEAAGEAIASGFNPIVALSYVERGDTLRGIDDASAVYFYDLALINTMWYLIIAGSKVHAVTTTPMVTSTSTPATSPSTQTVTTPVSTTAATQQGSQSTTTLTLTSTSTQSAGSGTSSLLTNLPGGDVLITAIAIGMGALLGAIAGALLSRKPRSEGQ